MIWTFEHTEHGPADRDAVWRLWSDVATWPSWDAGVERATLAGPFAEPRPLPREAR